MRFRPGSYFCSSLFSILSLYGYLATAQLTYYDDGVPCTVSAGVTVFMDGHFINQTNTGVDGSFDNQGTISITGDWSNNATLGGQVFSTSAGTVQFLGTANAQTIGGTAATAFFNLTTNNTFATGPQLVLSISTIIKNNLTMTSGVMNLGSNNLTLGTSILSTGTLTHGGTSASGWLYGTGSFIRWFATGTGIADGGVAGLFPMGTPSPLTNTFRPIYAATAGPAPGGTISASHTDAIPGFATTNVSITDGASTITRIHNVFWALAPANGIGGAFDLRAEQVFAATFVGNVNDLRLTPSAGVVGTAGINGGTLTNPIVRRTGVTAAQLANQFHIGTVDISSSPLPVTLVYFEATVNDLGKVELKWKTATEINTDYFAIERSKDGKQFGEIGTLRGSCNSIDPHSYALVDNDPLPGISYYRLHQVDLDGHSVYSRLVAISLNGDEVDGPHVFPNPLNGRDLFCSFAASGQSDMKEISWVLYDLNGRQVDANQLRVKTLHQPVALSLSQLLPAGNYVIAISYEGRLYRTGLIAQ